LAKVPHEFNSLIQKDRQDRRQEHFQCSLLDYLSMVKDDPDVNILAHERMQRLITAPGVKTIKTEEHPNLRRLYGNSTIKVYRFFEEEFYGIDRTIMEIARYFYAAAMRGEESRQVLYLVGPVGSGKSSLMESLKQALESSPPIYVIQGCPMREEPLHLIPKHLLLLLPHNVRR
jgi:serine protein kinase